MNWLWFFFSFKGRVARIPYWLFMLAILVIGFLIGIAETFFESFDSELYTGMFSLLALWPTLAVHAKRWHDRNRSAWWLPIGVIPIGVLWILIECVFLPGTPEDNRFGPVPSVMLGTTGKADRFQLALSAVLIGLTVVAICYPRYRIPSGNMMPTLLIGDFIVASRLEYGIPIPFTRREAVSFRNPIRGDVIIFRYPGDLSVEYIERIIGEPGDRIAYFEKQLYINGESLHQSDVDIYVGEGWGSRETGTLRKFERQGDVEYSILINPESPDYSPGCNEMEGYEVTVPDNHYFVMGDNRDNSNDSRCRGFVPRDYVIGKALRVWLHWDGERQGSYILYSRLLAPVH